MSLRVAIIGPRRSHTGTGPYVARFLRGCGCDVFEWTREDALSFLSGSTPSSIDAVAICSPPATHFDFVSAALRRSLHVFCEKPIVWPGDHSPSALRRLIADLTLAVRSVRHPVVLHENTQWRYTLPEYRRLVGEHALNDIREFSCELAPSSGVPEEMIMESAPHANSLLLAAGCSGMENLSVTFHKASAAMTPILEAGFEARSPKNGKVSVQYRFQQCANQPRPASYAMNGQWVRRRIEAPDYQIVLCHRDRETRVTDPLECSVRDFVQKAEAGRCAQRDQASFLAMCDNLEMSAKILERIQVA